MDDRSLGYLLVGLLIFLPTSCRSPEAPTPPVSGGRRYVLSFEGYEMNVAPVLRDHGCAGAGDCHGGGYRGTLRLAPVDRPDAKFDFHQTSLQVDGVDPDASPLLREPLALEAGGTPHPFKVFADTNQGGFRAIHAWIASGHFE